MLGQHTQSKPIQSGTPLQEVTEVEAILPPRTCLDPHLGSANGPIIPTPPTQEDFGRDKDHKTLLKSLQPKNFSGKTDNISNTLKE